MNDAPLSSERAARRRAILEAAVRTFARKGFSGSRTREIAAEAGIAEGTIYLYFESKDDLLLTAFRERVRQFSRAAQPLLEGAAPFAERLSGFIELQFSSIEEDPALATVLLLETRQSTQFYGEPVREVLREYATMVDVLLRSGVEEGAVAAEVDIPIARRMLMGALEEIGLSWLAGDRSRPLVPTAPRVASLYFGGLAPRREQHRT